MNSFLAALEVKATPPGQVPSSEDLRRMVDSFDWEAWREETEPIIAESFGSMLKDSARKRSREIGITFNEEDPFLQRRLTTYVGTRITELEGTTKDRVTEVIRNAFANGEGLSLPELGATIADSVRETFDGYEDWRADRIARSETAIAYNTGDLLAWMQAGVRFVEVQDGTENDEPCRQANGQIWPIEYALDNPIEHPNCERSFTPVLDGTEEAGVRLRVMAWLEAKAAELEQKAFNPDQPRDENGRWSGDPEQAFGSDHPYLYHVTDKNASISSFARHGIKPSTRGYDGAGVYLGVTPEVGYGYVGGPDETQLLRVNKANLVRHFGTYPHVNDGLQYDNGTGEVFLEGNRAIPPHLVEHQTSSGVWKQLKQHA
jgi:hypothetical protein